ncbi:MAG: hypothetical protein MPEBLZ_02799, partial [Candidatus Methanoperedens nitroreducens]
EAPAMRRLCERLPAGSVFIEDKPKIFVFPESVSIAQILLILIQGKTNIFGLSSMKTDPAGNLSHNLLIAGASVA